MFLPCLNKVYDDDDDVLGVPPPLGLNIDRCITVNSMVYLQPVSKRVETLLVKNAIYDIFILLPCIAPFPPDQCCPNFRIIFKLLGSNFEMGRGVQNKIYMFIFEARAYL